MYRRTAHLCDLITHATGKTDAAEPRQVAEKHRSRKKPDPHAAPGVMSVARRSRGKGLGAKAR